MSIEDENIKHIIEIINFTDAEAIGTISTINPKDRDLISIINSGCKDMLKAGDKQEVIDIAQCISKNLNSRVHTPQSSKSVEQFLRAILATLDFFIDAEQYAVQRQKQPIESAS